MIINWNVINVRGKKVNIYNSRDGGLSWNVIGRSIPNSGQFIWNMPPFDTTSYFQKLKLNFLLTQELVILIKEISFYMESQN